MLVVIDGLDGSGKSTLFRAVTGLLERLDGDFDRAVELLYACKGRVVVTGIGKSGIIGKKIAATLTSTGTPALFLHPAEGVHGDLGIVRRGDAVIAISYSGERSRSFLTTWTTFSPV